MSPTEYELGDAFNTGKIVMKLTRFNSLRMMLSVCSAFAVVTSCSTVHQENNIEFLFDKNVPLIEGKIAGSDVLLFLIDTGVDPSVVDLETARRVGLYVDETEVEEASGTGDGTGLAVMRSSIVDLSISGRKQAPIEALAADLSSFSRALETDLAGILGYSFLKGQVVRIDYRSKEIAFADTADDLPSLSAPTTTTYSAPLQFNSGDDSIPVFDVLIRGELVTVSLDTGKSAGIEFYKPVTDRLKILSLTTDRDVATKLGARGARTVKTGVMKSLELGPFVINDVAVSFSDKIPTGESREGNAGNTFLRKFVVTIDYVNHQIIFER